MEFNYPGPSTLHNQQVGHNEALEACGEFFLVGEVGDRTCLDIAQAMLRVGSTYIGQTAKPSFLLHINTPGGDVPAGLMLGGTIMRIRREFGISVNTHVLGNGM